jgi:hypothetical protein
MDGRQSVSPRGWPRGDGQGWHRTAAAADAAGAEWAAGEAAALLGAARTIEEFAIDRLDPADAHLDIDGERISAVPVFDTPATGDDGVFGRLGPLGGNAEIGVAEWPPQIIYTPVYERMRRNTRHRGLVVICAGGEPGMGLLNAERFRQPYGAPAVHVASEARDIVRAAAERGTPARLVAAGRHTPAAACNVVAVLPGRDRARPPVVIMTPRSSRWQSTAERGGGIVCWLESMRSPIAAPPGCDVLFTANSGHELGHLGLDDFLAHRPGWETHATWMTMAPISARRAASCSCSRRARSCGRWLPPSYVPTRPCRSASCRAARPATLTEPAAAIAPWSAAIPGSTCRRIAGRMPSTLRLSRASPTVRRGWRWH